MTISDWLDEQVAEGVDVSHIRVPAHLAYDGAPDETLVFEEFKPCGILCDQNHPFATVERFGHWYGARGQDKAAGIHTSAGMWRLFTRDKALALSTAKAHMQ